MRSSRENLDEREEEKGREEKKKRRLRGRSFALGGSWFFAFLSTTEQQLDSATPNPRAARRTGGMHSRGREQRALREQRNELSRPWILLAFVKSSSQGRVDTAGRRQGLASETEVDLIIPPSTQRPWVLHKAISRLPTSLL
jgi:hypothetical protein